MKAMELVWRRISSVYTLCLVLSNVDVSLGDSLPGSCIAAGYTSCCDSDVVGNCAGDTESCFCDPSCREFSDCCSDLDEICPQKDVFSPLAVFVPHVSYHSASVQWATAHINVSFSHTYHISYSVLFANSSSNDSLMATRIQHATIGDVYSVTLSSLLPNSTYVSSIISSSEIHGEMIFEGPMISTLPHPTVRRVHANWLNSSSAQVWWEQLMLPQNVEVLEYLVDVHRNDIAYKGEVVIEQWRFAADSGHGLITGLDSHTGYSISVRAKVRDVDGTVFETGESPKIHFFIPGRQLFQLQGSSSVPCSAWNIETENQVSTTFLEGVLAAIRSKCGCPFHPSQITDTSLLCHGSQTSSHHNSSSTDTRTPSVTSTSTSYVTFRAGLFSTDRYATDSLMEFVEDWVRSAPLLRDEKSGTEIKIIPQCTLRLSRKSEPFCSDDVDGDRIPLLTPIAQNLEVNRTEPLCISVPILVASLAAEFLLLLTVFLIGTVIALMILSRRDKKRPSSELSYLPSRTDLPGNSSSSVTRARHSSAAAANIYSTAPSREGGREEPAKEDEGERPSNEAATVSTSHTNTSPDHSSGGNLPADADS